MTDVQKVILSIFENVTRICSTHNIPYYAIGGTCIGAVRHHGFIPWDDDLDIAIPIEFYDDFIKIAKKELPFEYEVLTPDSYQHYNALWAKVCDKRTTFIENNEYSYRDSYKGVFVDVMPISGIPDSKIGSFLFCKRLQYLDRFNHILRFSPLAPRSKRYSKYLPFIILSKILPFKFFSNIFIRLLQQYPFYKSSQTGYVWYTCWLDRLKFPTTWFGEGFEMPFETSPIKCPKKFHEYLTFQFGDYMTLPPENKRQVHMGFVDLNTPYTEYQKKGLDLMQKHLNN